MFKTLLLLVACLLQGDGIIVSQATFFKSETKPVVLKSDAGFLIIAPDVSDKKQGVSLQVAKSLSVTSVEVSKLVVIDGLTFAVFPPQQLEPLDSEDKDYNVYIIQGSPGQRFGVSVREVGKPQWFEVVIAGAPTDPDPSPSPIDVSDIAKIHGPQGDDITRAEILKNLKALTFTGSFDEAVNATKVAISNALLDAPAQPPYKDWEGEFRKPVNEIIKKLNVTTVEQWKQVVDAMIKGLSAQPSTITMYTRDNCLPCAQWKQEVWPSLEALGWRIVEVPNSTKPSVPSFEINDRGKIVTHEGYISYDVFSSVINALRN